MVQILVRSATRITILSCRTMNKNPPSRINSEPIKYHFKESIKPIISSCVSYFVTSKKHFPHRHQEPQNRFRGAGEGRSHQSGRTAYPCKTTLKIQLVNLTSWSTKFSAMLHKNFGCGVLYSCMEILPKVDEAAPPLE